MADKDKEREISCPFRDDIKDLKDLKELVADMANQQNDMFNRLFVQNGSNSGKDCLAVQIQKNSKAREDLEAEADNERRNKWRRRGFYLTLIGLVLSNFFIIIKLFI